MREVIQLTIALTALVITLKIESILIAYLIESYKKYKESKEQKNE